MEQNEFRVVYMTPNEGETCRAKLTEEKFDKLSIYVNETLYK